MNKKSVISFLLIIATTVVLLYNMKGGLFDPPRMDVNLVFTSVKNIYSSLVFLAFTIVGVLIGVFIK